MTATAQPRARAAAVAPRPVEAERPPLRVVRPAESARRSQARRRRLVAASTVLLVAMTLFGVVVAHVVLTQNQFELQRVQNQAARQQAEYERLREQVAELESPSRIVAAAQERLGMVPPPSVKYLTPKAQQAAPASTASSSNKGGSSKQSAQDDAQQAMTEWSVVKHHLAP